MPRLANSGSEVPVCPVCDDQPCTHEFERGEYVFPDRLPKAPLDRATRDPDDSKPRTVKRKRGKRKKRGPEEDRMVRGPAEDRAR